MFDSVFKSMYFLFLLAVVFVPLGVVFYEGWKNQQSKDKEKWRDETIQRNYLDK